jgi:hypothetical protein
MATPMVAAQRADGPSVVPRGEGDGGAAGCNVCGAVPFNTVTGEGPFYAGLARGAWQHAPRSAPGATFPARVAGGGARS